jgi:hypothetical protein
MTSATPVTSSAAGASLRELMDRMGHSSPRAALIYLVSRELHQTGEGTADLRRFGGVKPAVNYKHSGVCGVASCR